jgi:hypothetical protein
VFTKAYMLEQTLDGVTARLYELEQAMYSLSLVGHAFVRQWRRETI